MVVQGLRLFGVHLSIGGPQVHVHSRRIEHLNSHNLPTPGGCSSLACFRTGSVYFTISSTASRRLLLPRFEKLRLYTETEWRISTHFRLCGEEQRCCLSLNKPLKK